jgi:hypothetical protein
MKPMKPTALATAAAFALCSTFAFGQSAGSTAGGSSKAGGPAATSTTTGAAGSGRARAASHGKHRRHSALSGVVLAQAGGPSGRGAVTGDPAASSAKPAAEPSTRGSAIKQNHSGSGTSTSGGRDDNGDQGRDKMPDSDKSVKPNDPDKH